MGKYFDPNICIFVLFTIFAIDLETIKAKYRKIYYSTRNLFIWAKILSQIAVHVYVKKKISKVHPACHNIVNGIKPGSNSKND